MSIDPKNDRIVYYENILDGFIEIQGKCDIRGAAEKIVELEEKAAKSEQPVILPARIHEKDEAEVMPHTDQFKHLKLETDQPVELPIPREIFEKLVVENQMLRSHNFTWIEKFGGEYHYFPMQNLWLFFQDVWSAASATKREPMRTVELSPDPTHAVLKHLKYRRCDDEYYLSQEGLAVLKGELLAIEINKAAYQPMRESTQPVGLSPVLQKAMKALEEGFFYSDYDEACVYLAAIKQALAPMRESGSHNKPKGTLCE